MAPLTPMKKIIFLSKFFGLEGTLKWSKEVVSLQFLVRTDRSSNFFESDAKYSGPFFNLESGAKELLLPAKIWRSGQYLPGGMY